MRYEILLYILNLYSNILSFISCSKIHHFFRLMLGKSLKKTFSSFIQTEIATVSIGTTAIFV